MKVFLLEHINHRPITVKNRTVLNWKTNSRIELAKLTLRQTYKKPKTRSEDLEEWRNALLKSSGKECRSSVTALFASGLV